MIAGAPAAPAGISSAHAPALDLPARFMALGMIGLVLVGLLAPWGMPLLLDGFYASSLLAFVHLMTLGVIASIVIGASYQLVPVVLQTELASPRLGRVSFWLYLSGVTLFLPGIYLTWRPGLAIGAGLLFSALLVFAGIIVWTLFRAPRLDPVASHIAVALAGLVGGVILGLTLALNKGTGFLGSMTLPLLGAHVSLMLGGWVLLMINGVAYRLVGMFTLSEDRISDRVVRLELGLVASGVWIFALTLLVGPNRWALVVASLMLLVGQALYVAQLAYLYWGRRRRKFDVHMPYAIVAAGASVGAVALLVIGAIDGSAPGSLLWVAVGWSLIAGMAITAIQGFFYKIATFLVWLNRYAPLAGRVRVPRLEEMYHLWLAKTGWAIWTLALALSLISLLIESRSLAQAAGLTVLVGLGCFLGNVAMIVSHWRPRHEDSGTFTTSVPTIHEKGQV